MDYKKKYEEALKRAKKYYDRSKLINPAYVLNIIFPELAESEDERIRKELLDIIQKSYELGGFTLNSKKDLERYVAWLEKQKEQAPQGLDKAAFNSEIEWEWVHREKQETDFISCAEMDKDEFIRFAKKFFELGQQAGAKWMAEQGETIETRFTKTKFRGVIAIRSFHKDGEYFKNEEEVIVQIRKKAQE